MFGPLGQRESGRATIGPWSGDTDREHPADTSPSTTTATISLRTRPNLAPPWRNEGRIRVRTRRGTARSAHSQPTARTTDPPAGTDGANPRTHSVAAAANQADRAAAVAHRRDSRELSAPTTRPARLVRRQHAHRQNGCPAGSA